MGLLNLLTPNMGGSIRAQRGLARSALFWRVKCNYKVNKNPYHAILSSPHRIVELKAIKTLPTRFEIARSEKNRNGFS